MILYTVSFVVALLAGMGIGSGGLLVSFLTVSENMPQLSAQGLNLFFFIFSSLSASAVHAKKQLLDFKAVALLGALGAVGALAGSSLARLLPAELLAKAFGIMLITSGLASLKRSNRPPKL